MDHAQLWHDEASCHSKLQIFYISVLFKFHKIIDYSFYMTEGNDQSLGLAKGDFFSQKLWRDCSAELEKCEVFNMWLIC